MYCKGIQVVSRAVKRIARNTQMVRASLCSTSRAIQFQHLTRRSVLRVHGPEAGSYLQGMVTNNVNIFDSLEGSPCKCIYALLLNPQGRVLYDCLVYKTGDEEFLLEHDAAAVGFIKVHLDMYRMRKKVRIDPVKDVAVFVALNKNVSDGSYEEPEVLLPRFGDEKDVIISVPDPRLRALGSRLIVDASGNLGGAFAGGKADVVVDYDVLRYKLGVGEGVVDHPPGNCLPFETNIDFLDGVSFNKGCYVGQELTARTHHTGVIRKRLMPVTLHPERESYPDFPVECVVFNEKGHKVGKLRNHIGKHGLAVLSVEESLKSEKLSLDKFDVSLVASKPFWWPESINPVHA